MTALVTIMPPAAKAVRVKVPFIPGSRITPGRDCAGRSVAVLHDKVSGDVNLADDFHQEVRRLMATDIHRQIGHVVGSVVAEQRFAGRAAEVIDEVNEIAALRLFVEERQVNFVDPFLEVADPV